MLNAPNGQVRRVNHPMPRGFELWADEDGSWWWFEPSTGRQGDLKCMKDDAIRQARAASKAR